MKTNIQISVTNYNEKREIKSVSVHKRETERRGKEEGNPLAV